MSTNRLIHATSPYLLQHAHNPVDWYEWGAEALTKAKEEDKPILVSIGYSACHWCHVMERESFENEDIAQLMNEYFVCIKVDREERPDIDQIYMEAVQAMNINGGWPLNVFLTPEQKPFYGGTYFPAVGWGKLLTQIHQAFRQRRPEIDASAEDLKRHLQTSDVQRFATSSQQQVDDQTFQPMFEALSKRFDRTWGGIEKAPKFVMPSVWLFLLRHFYHTKEPFAEQMVNETLTKMAQAGLYDQLAGGFARYSVDGEWFAPHFEKMLYDNAQLLSLYAEAYALQPSDRFKEILEETCSWLQHEMTHPQGGFYSALDADSEGVEGKFYTWTHAEVTRVLGPDSLLEKFYQVQPEGNWEHGVNILSRVSSLSDFASQHQVTDVVCEQQLAIEKRKLLEARAAKVRPGLDDKILSGWNAMTIVGLTDVYRALGHDHHLQLARQAMLFIENNLVVDHKLIRSYKNKPGTTEAFLEDYAYLIQAYQKLYEVTFDEHYIRQASYWTNYVLQHFYDERDHYFYYTSGQAEQLISRKKELLDNVIPSSNALMARNLLQLGSLLDRPEWSAMATTMILGLKDLIKREPVYMSYWAIALQELHLGLNEVAIVGADVQQKRGALQARFLPFSIFCGTKNTSTLPLLETRAAQNSETWIYVCRQKACQLPVKQVVDALAQIHHS